MRLLESIPLFEFLASPAAAPFWPWLGFVVGLFTGSFANVCIHRLPVGRSVVRPRSSCPHCGALIPAWHNVPLASFLVLHGRCATCRAAISWRYPAVELANGVAYLGLIVLFGPTLRAAVLMVFVTALVVLSLIDLEHYLLPDVITLPGVVFGVLASFLPAWPVSPAESLASAAAGYGVLALVALTWRRLRGIEALGQGDWKMVAMLGAFLGWQAMLLTVLLATTGGTVVGVSLMVFYGQSSRARLPLGTFLGWAGIVVVFLGRPLLDWYQGLFRV